MANTVNQGNPDVVLEAVFEGRSDVDGNAGEDALMAGIVGG